MENYEPLVELINSCLAEFKTYLSDRPRIAALTQEFDNPKYYWDLTKTPWSEGQFPNSEYSGVYFMFAKGMKPEKEQGLYVGKASHNSFIGARLYSHLNQPLRDKMQYPVQDKEGNNYLVECVTSIEMDDVYFLAPALEEFLIYELQKKPVNLINSLGKAK
jgi:hypothetical protein